MVSVTIRDADITSYREHGVVCLRNVIPADMIECLREAMDANEANPGPMHRANTVPGKSERSYLDFQLWQRHEACRRFVFEPPAAEIAASLLQSEEVVFYHDRVRVREAGTPEGSFWHHDQPYYPIDGDQIVSLWLPLEPVSAATGLEYISGSHRWGRWFQPKRRTKGSIGTHVEDPRFEPLPNIEEARSNHEFLSWDTEPGDVIAFHGLTLHGATGSAGVGHRCRTWETRWCGEDARYAKRIGQITPALEGHGLEPGDPLSCALFPKVLPR